MIFCVFFAVWIIGFGVWLLVKTPSDISVSERRALSRPPELTAKSVGDGTFFTKVESYLLDQFPLRETFRRIKAVTRCSLLRQTDNHGIVIRNGHAAQIETPTQKSVDLLFKRLGQLTEKLGGEDGTHRFFATLIPDKMFFLGEEIGYPTVDYTALRARMTTDAPGTYLDSFDLLTLDDYYATDLHWRQECIVDVADALLSGMGRQTNANLRKETLDAPFYGVYYGQAALPLAPDEMTLVRSDVTDYARVLRMTNNAKGFEDGVIYDEGKISGGDPYDVFLGGACPVTVLENPLNESGAKLCLFSDSYGRSLAPLLLCGYSRVVIYDVRYISVSLAQAMMPIAEDADVLFAFSMATVDIASELRAD